LDPLVIGAGNIRTILGKKGGLLKIPPNFFNLGPQGRKKDALYWFNG